MPSRNKIVIGISAVILLVILSYMLKYFNKSNYEIVETREFSCAAMTGFAFKYPVFKGWEVTKTTSSVTDCTIWLRSVGLAAQGIDTAVAPSITVTSRPVVLNPPPTDHFPPDLAARTDKQNLNGVYYEPVMESIEGLTYQSAIEFYVPMSPSAYTAIKITPTVGYSKAGFNENLFIQIVTDSFMVSLTLEQATQLAEQLINKNASVHMVIKDVTEKSTGWIFYYDSVEAVQTGDYQKYGVPGNNPLFVGKDGTTRFIPNPSDPIFQSK